MEVLKHAMGNWWRRHSCLRVATRRDASGCNRAHPDEMPHVSAAGVCATVLALGLLAAQGPVKITVNTQLVVETVSVTDKNGKPVEGPDRERFRGDRRRCGADRQFLRIPEDAGGRAGGGRGARAAAAPAADQVAPVTRGQIAPERPGDVRYKDRRLLALYFDMSAMPVPDQLRAQAAAVKFIRTQMQPADLMAILSFSDGVHVLRDFTDNRNDLENTVDKLFVGEGQGFDFTDADDSSADTGTAFGEDDSEFNLFNTDRQLAALQTAAQMLGTLNEKKVLIYFASGLRLSGVDNQAQFQATTNAAIRANVSLYSDRRARAGGAGSAGRRHQGIAGRARACIPAARRWRTPTTFRSRRIRCTRWRRIRAGRRCWTITTCRVGIVQAEQSISSYYIIGYYSANQNAGRALPPDQDHATAATHPPN